MDQNLAASHRVGVNRDLVIQELGETFRCLQRGSLTTKDAVNKNSVRNMTKSPVTTSPARSKSTSIPEAKFNQVTARNHATALSKTLITTGCTSLAGR